MIPSDDSMVRWGILTLGDLCRCTRAEVAEALRDLLETGLAPWDATDLQELDRFMASHGFVWGLDMQYQQVQASHTAWTPSGQDFLSYEAVMIGGERLELSVRTRNGLDNHGIYYLGELRVQTGPQLLKMKNFGRKCLNEVTDVLVEMGLSLLSHPRRGNQPFRVDTSRGSEALTPYLDRPIEDLAFNPWAIHVLKRAGIHQIGQLVVRTPQDLGEQGPGSIVGCGLNTYRHIVEVLKEAGLGLQMDVGGWRVE